MQPLTPDDLLPLEEFAARRRELFAAHARYLERYRRVCVGPHVTLLFENRQTLWYKVQEVLRVARLAEPALVRRELEVYNRLLPRRDRLQAALLIAVEEGQIPEALAPWRELRGDQLCLNLGSSRHSADLLTTRPEDRCTGTAHWVQFVLDARGRQRLADFRRAATLSLDLPGNRHDSGPLSDELRQSLLDDLQASDRDPTGESHERAPK